MLPLQPKHKALTEGKKKKAGTDGWIEKDFFKHL